MARAVDWIAIKDFSPGIFADLHGGIAATSRGSLLQDGAATIDGTYRCCADPSGALVPLPAATTTQSSVCLPGGNSNVNSAHYPAGFQGAYLMDVTVMGPVGGAGGSKNETTYSNGEGLIDVYTLYQFFYSPTGASDNWFNMWLGRVWHQADGTTRDYMWESSYPSTISNATVANYSLLSGNLETIRTQANQTTLPITMDRLYEAVAGVVRRNTAGRGSGTIPAIELTLSTFGSDVGGTYPSGTNTYPQGVAFIVPAPTSQFTLASFIFPTTETPQMIFGHQDRTSFVARTAARATNKWTIRDAVYYRAPLDVGGYALTNGAFATQYGGENTALVGTMSSYNTDELLLVKHNGGGVLVRGDLANPTVVRLRNIQSTYGVSSSSINTPIGLVYGSRNGVYLWTGGPMTVNLAHQIEGFFWQCGTEPYEAHRARFGYFDPWICVPNNFVYDTRTKSWWRLANPADRSGVPYNIYATDQTTGKMLAFPYKLTATQNVVYDTFDDTVLAGSYSWRSQPLLETVDTVTAFNQIRVVASPGSNLTECTVTVSLTGHKQDGTTVPSVAVDFKFTGNGTGAPVIKHKDLVPAFNAMYVRMTITASAATGAAPKIHSVELGKGAPRGTAAVG